jgi:tight adherence protein B
MTGELRKADILLRLEEFLGLNLLTAVAGFLLGLLLSPNNTVLILLFTLIGTLFPSFMVWRKKKAREAELNEQIGESLTGMANSLRAGYSFQQAMDLVSKETTGPLASEYRRTIREINLGVTTDEALHNLVERANNEDLELMISAVLIQRQIGGNLSEIFDKIVDTIRQRIRLKGEIKTLTAQGRISGIIVGLLPFFLFFILLIISPDYIGALIKSPIGWILLGGAVVSEIIGFMLIRKITNIEI